jgi:hypothetical protein
MIDRHLAGKRLVTAAVYSRAHLVDHMRTLARRQLYNARYWRQEADAAYSLIASQKCRAYARQALRLAGACRRRLLVFMNEPGQYVTTERYDRIMRGEW